MILLRDEKWMIESQDSHVDPEERREKPESEMVLYVLPSPRAGLLSTEEV